MMRQLCLIASLGALAITSSNAFQTIRCLTSTSKRSLNDQCMSVRNDKKSNSAAVLSMSQNDDEITEGKTRRQMIQKCLVGAGSLLGVGVPNASAAGSFDSSGKPTARLGGLPNKIRNVGNIMDELQRDLMQERWDLVEQYPPQLRSLVPLFTQYTDSAFPSEAPSDYGLRVALRYEVGRFFASLERLKLATGRRALDEAYVAYSDMAVHYDRYLHVGGLYSYYDASITNEVYYKDTPKSSLVYSDPVKDPPEVRDLVVISEGPDMGKTGILIGTYDDGSGNCIVKLDKYKGMREIKIVNKKFVAKRLGEQDPDEVFLIPRKNTKG